MKLQKATQLALYAVLELAAARDRQLSAIDIARRHRVSTHHLAKVLRRLVRAGWVEAVRGAGGGYRFVGDPNRTTLLEVIEAFEPVGGAGLERARGVRAQTPIGAELMRIGTEIDELTRSVLESITLKTAISRTDGHR
jgi:Rrf2 family protein